MSDDDKTEEHLLTFDIGVRGDWIVTRVRANPEGTEPGAEVLILTNPSWPDSYTEFMTLSSIFTESFMKESGDAMSELIGNLIAEHPEVAEQAKEEVVESARLAGFSEEEAVAISEMDFPVPEEGSPA
jgi:hypothetical protein